MASLPLLCLSLRPATTPSSLSKPLAAPPPSAAPLRRIQRRSPAPVRMSYSPIPATDRLISSAAYFLPFFNGLQYGRFLFAAHPSLSAAFDPLLPLLSAYRSFPYASFVAFFALYLGVVRNPSFSRFVRFNSMQAVVLDVLLALPLLLQRILGPVRGLGLRLIVAGYNAIFVFTVACFLYSLVSCILGRIPYLPLVASAADRQL